MILQLRTFFFFCSPPFSPHFGHQLIPTHQPAVLYYITPTNWGGWNNTHEVNHHIFWTAASQNSITRSDENIICLVWMHELTAIHDWLVSLWMTGVMPFIPPKEHSQFFSLDYLDGWLWNCQDSDLWSPEDLLLCNLIAESSLQPCNQGSSEIWKVVSNKFVRWCQINLLDQIGWWGGTVV